MRRYDRRPLEKNQRVNSNPSTSSSARASTNPHRRDLDSETLRALTELDPAALGLFYELYFDRLYGYVRRMVGEEHLAEDVTQDIFMHIYKSLPKYDPTRALRPWIFTIATNKVRDFWRSRRHRDTLRETSYDAVEGDALRASNEKPPQGVLENAELGVVLTEAIERLPDSMRATLLLRYFEGLSFEAIGEILNRNEAAVRKRYSRAMEYLREDLTPAMETRGELGGSEA